MAVSVPINFFANVDDAAKQFSQLTTVLKGVAAAFAVNKIIDGLGSAISEANNAEKSFKSLKQALVASGDFSERNANEFKRLAGELSKVSKYDDDLILSQFAVAKQFGATNKQAASLVEAAVRLSEATGKDLPEATQLLSRSLDGTGGKLNELIPGVRSLTSEQLRNGAAIELVSKRYKDAVVDLSTYDGATTGLIKSFNDFQKAVGSIFTKNEVVIKIINDLSSAFSAFTDVIIANKKELIALVSEGIIFVIKGVGVFAQLLRTFQEPIEILKRDISGLFRTIGAIPELIGGNTNKALKDLDNAFKADDQAGLQRLKVYDQISESVAQYSLELEKTKDIQAAITEETKKTKQGFDGQDNTNKSINTQLLEQFETLKKQSREIGTTQAQQLRNKYNVEMQLLNDVTAQKIKSEQEVDEVRRAITEKFYADFKKAREEELKNLVSNPLSGLTSANNLAGLSPGSQDATARLVGGLTQAGQGRAGATNLLAQGAELAGQAFLGVPGMGELFKVLAQGPDQVRMMLTEFANAIPDIIQAFVEAIPVVVEVLTDKAPEIITRIIEKIPDMVAALVSGLAKSITKTLPFKFAQAAASFLPTLLQGAGQFVSKILDGAGQFIQRLLDEIGKVANKLNPIKGNPLGNGDVGSQLENLGRGLVNTILPPGLNIGGPNFNPLANLAVGKSFGSSGGNDAATQPLNVVVKVGQRELANAMVDIKRYGFRTEPA